MVGMNLDATARVARKTAERFRTITTAYYRGAMGILLVYDVTDDKSFGNIGNWVRNIDTHAAPNVAKLLVGNKCDLVDKRVVEEARGRALAEEYGMDFLECSAKSALNVDEAFIRLAREIKTAVLDAGNAPSAAQPQGATVTPGAPGAGAKGKGKEGCPC